MAPGAMDLRRVKELRSLLGSAELLAIAEWVLQQPANVEFSLKEVQQALPDVANNVSKYLGRLVSYPALSRDDSVRGRPKWRRTSSLMWEGWSKFFEAFDQLE